MSERWNCQVLEHDGNFERRAPAPRMVRAEDAQATQVDRMPYHLVGVGIQAVCRELVADGHALLGNSRGSSFKTFAAFDAQCEEGSFTVSETRHVHTGLTIASQPAHARFQAFPR